MQGTEWGYVLILFYLVYSFLGWTGETTVAAIRKKGFVNRGIVSGPFCFVYGIAAVILTIGFADLRSQPLFLFVACAAMSTVIEWLTAKLLERLHRRRWWDYSGKKFNFDGYVCLQYTLLWGALGTAGILWGNGLLYRVYTLVPSWLTKPLLWIGLAGALLDQLASAVVVSHAAEHPHLGRLSTALAQRTQRLRLRITAHVEKRILQAYPDTAQPTAAEAAPRMPLADLLWLFVIGAFLGDIIETLYCRAVGGVWMSRSSLVWGPFSVVWGLALVLASILLRPQPGKERTDRSIFTFGFVMGGAYEYACSAIGEQLFGVIFWDYSGFMFNLGGRINLLYCFFWGVAAVVWMRYGYPLIAKLLGRVQRRIRPWMTVLLAVFMAANMLVSSLALSRYNARTDGVAPASRIDVLLDEHFDDTRMERIYPNAKKAEHT